MSSINNTIGKSIIIFTLMLFLFMFSFFPDVCAATPQEINYQGKLVLSGALVNNANQSIKFRITNSDGSTQYYTTGNVTVSVVNGLFTYVLDTSSITNWDSITPYLEITVNPATTPVLLAPREKLTAVAYALNADKMDGHDTSYFQAYDADLADLADGLLTATKIGAGTVDNTEFGYLNLVTSAIQTQLGTKAPLASPTFTGSVNFPGTGIWNSSGNIGIGTTVPSDKLDILAGDIRLHSADGDSLKFFREDTQILGSEGLGSIVFGASDGGTFEEAAKIEGRSDGSWSATSTPSQIDFYTTDLDSTTATERMQIQYNGYVGIGTGSPIAPLTVQQSTGAYTIVMHNETDEYTDGGRETILLGRGRRSSYRPYMGAIAFEHAGTAADDKGRVRFMHNNGSEPYTLQTGMTLDYTGNVGIGTTTPSVARLQVVGGDVKVGSPTVSHATANEDLFVKGNLEIDATAYIDGAMVIASGAAITGVTVATGHIQPAANDTYNLGQSTKKWAEIWVVDTHFGDVNFANDFAITEIIKEGKEALAFMNENGVQVMVLDSAGNMYIKGELKTLE